MSKPSLFLNYFLTLVFINMAIVANAQFGIYGGYSINQGPDIQYTTSGGNQVTESLIEDGPVLGLDYWIRLKNYRIEFQPQVQYSQFSKTLIGEDFDIDSRILGLFLNTNIYLFDLEGDCDCPTFSKGGNTLQKGFFLQLSPGVLNYNIKETNQDGVELEADQTTYSIGVGIGLDIGVSDLVTITPSLGWRIMPGMDWNQIVDDLGKISSWTIVDPEENFQQILAGIRIGIRLDQ